MLRRLLALAVVGAGFAPAGAAAGDEPPEIISIVDKCPVSEGGYRYFSDSFEYWIRVYLDGCPWYHGETAVVHGSLVRTDPVIGAEPHEMTVFCEPGAPPSDDGSHGHRGPAPPGPPEIKPRNDAPPPEVHRRPDDCVLSIVVAHPPVEHARYEGELRYPSAQGEQRETLTLQCTNIAELGGCDRPGSPPRVTPEPPPA